MGNLKSLAVAATLALCAASQAHSFCFEEAGAMYQINPQILRAIAKVESNFNPAALNKNTNGTYDVGLMQINSIWASALGEERWKQLGDACYNAKTGAWILSQCIGKYGYNWKAIGCYHSQTPDKRDHYAQMVFKQLQKVAPVAQEASYAPLKSQLAALVEKEVDTLVAEDIKKNMARLAQSAEAPSIEQPAEQPQEGSQVQPQEEPQVQPQEEPLVQPQEEPQAQPTEPQVQPEEEPQEGAPQEYQGEPAPPADATDPGAPTEEVPQ